MRWKMILYLACSIAGFTCHLLQGQQLAPGTVKYDLWQKDKTITYGFYKALKPVSIDGRTEGGGKSSRATFRVTGGATVQGSEFLCAFTTWNLEEAKMQDVTVRFGPANTLDAKKAEFSGFVLTFGLRDIEEAPDPEGTVPIPSDTANRIRLQDCTLTQCQLFRTITPSRTIPEWTGNTFTRVKLPEIVFVSDAKAELIAAGVRITRCRFVECAVPVSLLLATSDCAFENCTFTGDVPAQLKEPVRIAVAGTPPPLSAPQIALVDSATGAVATVGQSTGASTRVSAPGVALPAPAPVPGTAPALANGGTLARREARLHGLLIMELNSGKEAGQAAVMNAIALPEEGGQRTRVVFNQEVGEKMTKALQEVSKHLELLHGGWPRGFRIELGFADKYSNKDGPSAAVACALLIDSLITGRSLDPSFAVTGDMNADGSVQPIGGVRAKIRGATNGECRIVAIPAKNEAALADVLLTEGPEPFAAVQIFSIDKLQDAQAIGYDPKSPSVQKAVTTMAQVVDLMQRDRSHIRNWLQDPRVTTKLQQALADAPNHLSAKYLLMWSQGRTPVTLTLAGSLDAVEHGGSDIVVAIKSGRNGYDALKTQALGGSIGKLQFLRPKVDPRVRPYLDGILSFANLVKEIRDRPPSSASRAQEMTSKIMAAAESADDALSRLLGDPAVVEELRK
jgi:hypothetical protein